MSLTERRPVSGWNTVVVSRWDVVIHVRDPVAFTPAPMLETAVATIVCSKPHSQTSKYYGIEQMSQTWRCLPIAYKNVHNPKLSKHHIEDQQISWFELHSTKLKINEPE